MTAITRPFQWLGGSLHTGSRDDQDHDAILLAQDPPGCLITRAAAQSINNTAFTQITFDTELSDNDGMFAASSTTVTIQHDGYYLVVYGVDWGNSATGTRVANVLQNGTAVPAGGLELPTPATGNCVFTGSTVITAVTSDTVKLEVWQNSGGALNVDKARLAVVRLFGPGS